MEVQAAFETGTRWSVFQGEWSEEDRAMACAWISYRNSVCAGCGSSLIETTDPRMEGRYEPDGFVQCHRCVGIEQAIEPVENAAKANPAAHPRRGTYRYEIKRLPPRPLR